MLGKNIKDCLYLPKRKLRWLRLPFLYHYLKYIWGGQSQGENNCLIKGC